MRVFVTSPTTFHSLSSLTRDEVEEKLRVAFSQSNSTLIFNSSIDNENYYYKDLSDPGVEARSVAIAQHIKDISSTHKFDELSINIKSIGYSFFPDGIVVISAATELVNSSKPHTPEEFDKKFNSAISSIFAAELIGIKNLILDPSEAPCALAWIHKTFLIDTISGFNKVSRFIKSTTEADIDDTFRSHFGWGDSLINLSQYNSPHNLYSGCVISQYFYFAFHQLNKLTPDVIRQLNSSYKIGKLSKVRKEGFNLKQRVFELDIQYADYIHSVAGEMREAASQFHQNWRISELRSNLINKIPVLQDLLQDAEHRSARQSDTFVEVVLFVVSIFSLVGLFLGANDYLTKPTELHKASIEVLRGMLPNNPSDILSLAVFLSISAIFLFLFIKIFNRHK